SRRPEDGRPEVPDGRPAPKPSTDAQHRRPAPTPSADAQRRRPAPTPSADAQGSGGGRPRASGPASGLVLPCTLVMTTPSVLATDAYKFSMAQAGFPLRRETFYLSFRFGGFQYVPFDLAAIVRAHVADLRPGPDDLAFARAHGYGLSDAMEA